MYFVSYLVQEDRVTVYVYTNIQININILLIFTQTKIGMIQFLKLINVLFYDFNRLMWFMLFFNTTSRLFSISLKNMHFLKTHMCVSYDILAIINFLLG
jgi:hypothetical protein